MRVLMTTDTVGGVWSFTKELASELLTEGCAIALVSVGRAPSEEQQAWADAERASWGARFRFEPLDAPLEWMTENERAFDDVAPVLARVAAEFDAELLLSSQYCFGAIEWEIPSIVVAHSDVLSWGEACHPEGLQESAWLDRYRELVAEGLDRADAVVAPTRWMLNALAANFRLPRDCCVIANGRNVPELDCVPARKMQAVTAGRLWDEAKNLAMLGEVHSPMPLLIGGETEYESAQLSSGGGEAKLLGRLSETELLGVFRESAIYVCPSRYEPFGLAPLEAALCGCAVLANNLPSLREVWGEAALYFLGPDSLSGWLRRLSDDGVLLREAQRRAVERAREFTAGRMARAYLELFRAVLAGGRRMVGVRRYVA